MDRPTITARWPTPADARARLPRGPALRHGLILASLVLLLDAYWFGVANRHLIFLYFHDMGPLVPDTGPFSRVTGSRYWMTGLVAGGLILAVYSGYLWLRGRLRPGHQPPSRAAVWLAAAPPLLVGVPWITMTAKQPVLPWTWALRTTLVTLLALALALAPARLAAHRPLALVALLPEGWAVAALLLSLSLGNRAIALWARGLRWPAGLIAAGALSALVGLLGATAIYAWRRAPGPTLPTLLLAGFSLAYLLLPLLQYLGVGLSEGYFYISDSDNYFARHWAVQGAAWLATAGLLVALVRWRRRLADR